MTVTTVNVHEAKTRLSQLLVRISMGEEVVIAKAGQPVARLVPYVALPATRAPGSAAGRITISPDFDDPLPDALFEDIES